MPESQLTWREIDILPCVLSLTSQLVANATEHGICFWCREASSCIHLLTRLL